MSLKKLTLLAVLVALVVALEQALSYLPSVQVTTLLIVIISTSFDRKYSLLAVFVYVTLDNILGGFTFLYPFMLISWSLFSLTINRFRNHNELVLAIISLVFGLVHMIVLGIPNILIYKLKLIAYVVTDIPFTAIFMLVNFLTVLWLYSPLKKIIDMFLE
ncbi:MAG TPA: hypothetical protein PK924_00980 [Bacilli bacterium]|nr:hypothetical protein [Bacilli bacterium]